MPSFFKKSTPHFSAWSLKIEYKAGMRMISGITHLKMQKSTTITAFTHLGIGSHLKYSLTKLKQSLTLLITFFIIVLTFLLHVVEYAYFLYYAYILYNYKIEKYKKKKRYMYILCTYTFLLIIPLSLYNSELFLLIPLHPSIVVLYHHLQ